MPIEVNCTRCGKPKTVKPSHANRKHFCSRVCLYAHKSESKMYVPCFRCGQQIQKPPSQIARAERNFCSRQCNMKTMNEEMNPTRMTFETRSKISEKRFGTGSGKAYPKLFGRHVHRIVAEQKLGRQLAPGEVVHHKDENIQNFDPDNLEVMSSQSEHASLHWHKRGDA